MIRLLLGKKKEYGSMIRIRKKNYMVRINEFILTSEWFKKAKKILGETLDGKEKIKFSRENIGEFIRAVAPETEKISISLSAEGDEAILQLPFTKETLSVKGGESIQFGATIPGAIPQRRVMSVQSDE